MHNRVSRYPFPDHHPPPLPLLPLAAREMTAWLEGDPERVAIIHCKAGKVSRFELCGTKLINTQGRSGTLLCSYMLSLSELPPPPQLDTSYSQSELAAHTENKGKQTQSEQRDGWVVVGSGNTVAEIPVSDGQEHEGTTTAATTPPQSERVKVKNCSTTSSLTTVSRTSSTSDLVGVSTEPDYDPIDVGDEQKAGTEGQKDRANGKVDAVFKLHSSRRMKPSSNGRGVSIPSRKSSLFLGWLLTRNRTTLGTIHQPPLFPTSSSILSSHSSPSSPLGLHHHVSYASNKLATASHSPLVWVECRAGQRMGLGSSLQ